MATERLVRGTNDETARGVRRLAPAGVLLALAGLAWVASDLRMAGMDAGPGTDPGAFGFYISTWVLMMAAMMLPTIAPAAVAADAREPQRALVGQLARSAAFVGAYLVVWVTAGLVAYELISAVHSVAGARFAWDHAGRWTALAVLVAAGAYQLTGRKRRALARCRRASSRPRSPGLAGLTAGVDCLRSSWLMMAALFALGVMSLWWMAVVATLTAAERLPRRSSPGRLAGAAIFLAIALGVALSPNAVPGLTVPGSSAANKAMMRMSPGPGMSRGGASGMSTDERSMR